MLQASRVFVCLRLHPLQREISNRSLRDPLMDLCLTPAQVLLRTSRRRRTDAAVRGWSARIRREARRGRRRPAIGIAGIGSRWVCRGGDRVGGAAAVMRESQVTLGSWRNTGGFNV